MEFDDNGKIVLPVRAEVMTEEQDKNAETEKEIAQGYAEIFNIIHNQEKIK